MTDRVSSVWTDWPRNLRYLHVNCITRSTIVVTDIDGSLWSSIAMFHCVDVRFQLWLFVVFAACSIILHSQVNYVKLDVLFFEISYSLIFINSNRLFGRSWLNFQRIFLKKVSLRHYHLSFLEVIQTFLGLQINFRILRVWCNRSMLGHFTLSGQMNLWGGEAVDVSFGDRVQ